MACLISSAGGVPAGLRILHKEACSVRRVRVLDARGLLIIIFCVSHTVLHTPQESVSYKLRVCM